MLANMNLPDGTGKNLSASQWNECKRALWFKRVDAVPEMRTEEALIKMEMGKALESVIIEQVKRDGFNVVAEQVSIKEGSSYIGTLDAVLEKDGIPYVGEFKAVSNKVFKAWLREGAPVYYHAQLQLYLLATKYKTRSKASIQDGVFVVLNRDSGEVHHEFVKLSEGAAQHYYNVLEEVSKTDTIPQKFVSWKCKMCTYKKLCKGEPDDINIHCATCGKAEFFEGSIICKTPCDGYRDHILHPHLVELYGYTPVEFRKGSVYYKEGFTIGGRKTSGVAHFSSGGFADAIKAGAITDEVLKLCQEFHGAVESAEKLDDKA